MLLPTGRFAWGAETAVEWAMAQPHISAAGGGYACSTAGPSTTAAEAAAAAATVKATSAANGAAAVRTAADGNGGVTYSSSDRRSRYRRHSPKSQPLAIFLPLGGVNGGLEGGWW